MAEDAKILKGQTSPFVPMFEQFRAELDAHYDTRERIIKASRDVTAASKKIIFALQRVKTVNKPIGPGIARAVEPHYATIKDRLNSISADVQHLNAYRYASNITGGIQELQEALLFQHYLETQTLLPFDAADQKLAQLSAPEHPIALVPDDYLLGIFDMTGEVMRFAITNIATSGRTAQTKNDDPSVAQTKPRTALDDLRQMRFHLELLQYGQHFTFLAKDARSKLKVTQASVEKVEKAMYGLVVRGSERPEGWVPDVREERMDVEA